jgi:hypothetical protein
LLLLIIIGIAPRSGHDELLLVPSMILSRLHLEHAVTKSFSSWSGSEVGQFHRRHLMPYSAAANKGIGPDVQDRPLDRFSSSSQFVDAQLSP